MRYPASETRKIITLVEQSHVPAKRRRYKLGIADKGRFGFFRFWYTEVPAADRFNVKRGKKRRNFFFSLPLLWLAIRGFSKRLPGF
jgi:hypothetical protein